MPDSVTSSSIVEVKLHAPGGIQMGTVQDTTRYPIETLVQLFGTNNVNTVQRSVTRNISNVITNQTVTEFQTRPIISASLSGGITKQTVIPVITRLPEREYTRGSLLALYTASRPEAEATQITRSIEIVLDPVRELSSDSEVKGLIIDTASYDEGEELASKIDLATYVSHKSTKEPEFGSIFTHSISTVELSDYAYTEAGSGLADALNTSNKFTKYYISDDILYTDPLHTTVFSGGGHNFFKVSGSNEAWGITSKGTTYYKYQDGMKEKPKFRLVFNTDNVSGNPSFVCEEGDKPSLQVGYWYDQAIHKDELLSEQYPIVGETTKWIKNITWDEALLISASSGVILDSQPC